MTRKLRSLAAAALALASALVAADAAPAQERKPDALITVHLLGTGAPIPRVDRFGPATLVTVAGKRFLFDAGRGVSQRLWQLGLSLGAIDAVFLTHLHSDHLVGLPDLWLTGWLQPEYGRRQKPLRIMGPEGVRKLTESLSNGFAPDIAFRSEKEGLPLAGVAFDAREIQPEQTVLEEDGVSVRAFEVDHGAVKPAFGFRIDFAGKSVVISGDTRYNENLIRHAAGADVLIHEVVAAAPALRETPFVQRQFGYHTSTADLARVFGATAPKLAVLTHFVLLGNAAYPAPTADDVMRELRETGYAGAVAAGVDLMRIDVGATSVTANPPAQKN